MKATIRLSAFLAVELGALTFTSAQVQQAWVARYNSSTNSSAVAAAMTMDGSGNIFVTGSLRGTNSASDFLTVKYDANGTQLWAQVYDGLSNSVDVAASLAIDAAGGVYVTGSSDGTITTIKYDANGSLLWAAHYQAPAGSVDLPVAIAVDGSGSVVVSSSVNTGNNCDAPAGDYLTIKYGPSGNELWVVRFDGAPISSLDHAKAMVVDSTGNVYVTGNSVSQCVTTEGCLRCISDYATIKYDSEGRQLWASRYSAAGPSNDAASDDIPNAIAVDRAGNVYVTGSSGICTRDPVGRVICMSDYATVKYDPDGNELWVARYDGPAKEDDVATAVAVDDLGNVLVTGWSSISVNGDVGEDFVTIKYDPQGKELWIARNGDPSHGNQASALALDAASNVYVTGSSFGGVFGSTNFTMRDFATVKYDAWGDQLWIARYDGPDHGEDIPVGFAVDKSNNVYITGSKLLGAGATNAFTTVKLVQNNVAGLPQISAAPLNQSVIEGDNVALSVLATGPEPLRYQWRFNGFDIPDATNATLAFPYVQTVQAGEYSVVVTNPVGLTVSAAGHLIVSPRLQLSWLATYGAELDPYDSASAIAVDGAGNVYVTGYVVADAFGNADYATVKYDAFGNQLWAARYDGPAHSNDVAVAVAVDMLGNAYVTGYSQGVGTSADYATLKYDPQGHQLWVARYSGSGNTYDRPADYAIKVDDVGNAYVTGSSATVKYDPNGNQLWVRTNFPASSLAVDVSGNVVVTGAIDRSPTNSDLATAKFDANGNQLWIAYYDGPAHSYERASRAAGLAVDGFGNVYVTGTSWVSYTNDDFVTVKYDANGNQLWAARYDGPTHGWDEARAVAVDTNLNVYVTGISDEAGDVSGDFVTIKYAPDGQQLWIARYDGPGHEADGPWAMIVGDDGYVYITGYETHFSDFGPIYRFLTLKYDSAGHQLAADALPDPNDSQAYALTLDAAGNVYVTGYTFGEGFLTAKYAQHPIAPELISPTMLNRERFLFTLRGEAQRSYEIQASTDLIRWADLTELFNGVGSVSFIDTIPTNVSARFYRAVKLP